MSDTDQSLNEFSVEDSASSPYCEIWFALPPGFLEVPLAVETESGEDTALEAQLGSILPRDQHLSLLADMEDARTMRDLLAQNGTIHFSIGVHQTESGEILHSAFLIRWEETAWTPTNLAAARAVLASTETQASELVDLPCGPAAISECLTKQDEKQVFQLTGYLPHPDGNRVAVLSLSTTAAADLAAFRDMFRGIIRMVSFVNPLPAHLQEHVQERPEVAAARAAFG
ncbi:hypothetical protein [Streptomyces catenulae]|uniref:DUF1795 domain-containing protein n=1 Tax=Streptomyces catenulae TaxID=66875 RepID=A0ABV2YWS1_9ACTN|nr:hypothetical protein [Streptomyces catenulae]